MILAYSCPRCQFQQAAIQAESKSSQTFTWIQKVAVGKPACVCPVVSGFLFSYDVVSGQLMLRVPY